MNLTEEILRKLEQVEHTSVEVSNILEQLTKEVKENSLNAAEVSILWTQYMGDSSAICVYSYFLNIVEDKEIESLLKMALHFSQSHIAQITHFFNQAHFQIPMGFKENDVNIHAPRLFSDNFMAFYTEIMTIHGLTAYSLAITTCEREDLRNYFFDCTVQAKELINKVIKLEQSKGLYSSPPSIPSPEIIEFMNKKGLLSSLIGSPQPLAASEIGNLFFNTKKNSLNKALFLAFSQVAKTEDVRKYMLDGVQNSGKDIDSFITILEKEHLTTPSIWDVEVTNSTTSPFSDKLMMNHMAFLTSAALSFYATGLASSLRPDVILAYNQIFEHIHTGYRQIYHIMTKHGWMEKQPEAIDRKSLAQETK